MLKSSHDDIRSLSSRAIAMVSFERVTDCRRGYWRVGGRWEIRRGKWPDQIFCDDSVQVYDAGR